MNIDINACYFHSIILGEEDTLKVLDNILSVGKILPLSRGGYDSNKLRMNGDDEICLSKRINSGNTTSAYDLYARKKLSFILKGNLPNVYKPTMIYGKEIRPGYTSLSGEYRVRDEIDLDSVIGINLPVKFILNSMFGYRYFFCSNDEFKKMKYVGLKKRSFNTVEFYNKVKKIMDRHGVDLSIYDIDSMMEIDSSSDIYKIMRKG